jgi:trans-aconitate 2-methyltransferase
MWDPGTYLKFEKERSRPFFDLLTQLPEKSFRRIADLGCGPGRLTRRLAERWPEARVIGLDSSQEMLAEAEALSISARLEFEVGDLRTWQPSEPMDLVISSAALQWAPQHESLLPHLLDMLAEGGTLAVQVPDFIEMPLRIAIEQTVQGDRWRTRLAGAGLQPGCIKPLTWYVGELLEHDCEVNAWQTTYVHVLPGDNPVLEWIKGSALRPLLEKLNSAEANDFLQELGGRLRSEYPRNRGLTLFPFPRLFFVANRPT